MIGLQQDYRCVSSTIFIVLLFSLAGIAGAEELYSKSAKTVCGNTNVSVITECYADSDVLPSCTKQQFEFRTIGISNPNTINTLGKPGDYSLATAFACVKGKSQYYILINHNNGGNCEECEWSELFDLNGKKLTSDRNAKDAYERFSKIYTKLGLPKTWPRSSFIDIPLRRKY